MNDNIIFFVVIVVGAICAISGFCAGYFLIGKSERAKRKKIE